MKPKKLFYILLIAWMFVDLLQAIFTPVHADEAYYALYGQFLDWGYYDHPPMVALLTFFSSLLFKGNLSIRFATVLLHGATVGLVWALLPKEKWENRAMLDFFIMAFSLIMFSVYGVITTPDAPLLFFVALFFYLYKRYLEKPSWIIALLFGVTVAGMLYSKYMAVLLVLVVLISNFKLLKDAKIWVAGLLALLLFMPHVFWQFQNGFPSFKYHLIERNSHFRIVYFLEYLPNQLLVFNPIALLLGLWVCWKRRLTKDLFERACIFTVVVFVFFFWMMTFKGHAEPHWTVTASIPILFLLFQHTRNEQKNKWIPYGFLPIAILILGVRIVLPVFSAGDGFVINDRKRMNDIHRYCGDVPVAFTGSFQAPSLYRFYTGKNAVPLSSLYSRQTQYDLLRMDMDLQGKQVYVVGSILDELQIPNTQNVFTGDWQFYCKKYEHFQGTNRMEIKVDKYHVVRDTLFLSLTLHNPYNLPFDFNHPEFVTTLHVAYKMDEYFPITCPIPENIVIPAGESVQIETHTTYYPNIPFVICLDNEVCRSVNSKPMVVKK